MEINYSSNKLRNWIKPGQSKGLHIQVPQKFAAVRFTEVDEYKEEQKGIKLKKYFIKA